MPVSGCKLAHITGVCFYLIVYSVYVLLQIAASGCLEWTMRTDLERERSLYILVFLSDVLRQVTLIECSKLTECTLQLVLLRVSTYMILKLLKESTGVPTLVTQVWLCIIVYHSLVPCQVIVTTECHRAEVTLMWSVILVHRAHVSPQYVYTVCGVAAVITLMIFLLLVDTLYMESHILSRG